MSIRSDQFARLRANTDQHRLDFLKIELDLCSTFINLANTKLEAGNRESAKASIGNAEKAYATVRRFLSDPKHNQHMTGEDIQNIRAELDRLRARIDEL